MEHSLTGRHYSTIQSFFLVSMHFTPPCDPYRNRPDDETDEQYVENRKTELVKKIMAPVVGAVSRTSYQHVKR
jgi:hypothetical protein